MSTSSEARSPAWNLAASASSARSVRGLGTVTPAGAVRLWVQSVVRLALSVGVEGPVSLNQHRPMAPTSGAPACHLVGRDRRGRCDVEARESAAKRDRSDDVAPLA